MEDFRLLSAGEQCLVVEFGKDIDPAINKRVRTLASLLRDEDLPAIIEIVPTYRSLAIFFDPLRLSRRDLGTAVRNLVAQSDDFATISGGEGRSVTIPVCYGGEYGPDLAFVAEHAGMSEKDVIRLHGSRPYLVYMLGFQPGFPYLGGLPEELVTPRLEQPRTRVPAGSVGIAGSQTGFYTLESPGGWRIIGRTPLFANSSRRAANPPFSPGDSIRFTPISSEEFGDLAGRPE